MTTRRSNMPNSFTIALKDLSRVLGQASAGGLIVTHEDTIIAAYDDAEDLAEAIEKAETITSSSGVVCKRIQVA